MLLTFLLLSHNKGLHIDDAAVIVLLLCGGPLNLADLVCFSNNALRNGFLHEVHFRLADQFHVRVR